MSRTNSGSIATSLGREALLSNLVFIEGPRCTTWFDTLREPEAGGLRGIGAHLMGHSTLARPYVACRPYSQFELLLFPVEGQMRLILPNGIHQIRAGETWLVPANSLSHLEVLKGTFEMTWVHFNPGAIPSSLHPGHAVLLCNDPRIVSRMHWHLRSLRWENSGPGNNTRHFCHLLYELIQIELERLLHPDLAYRGSETILRVRKTWDLVENATTDRWDVQKMATHANLSTSRFYCLCMELFGMTPQQRLAQIRMNRAMGLLLATDQKIEAIASDAGYSSLFAFSKAFKVRFGESPRSFRERNGHLVVR